MSDVIETYELLEQKAETGGQVNPNVDALIASLDVACSVRIGQVHLTVSKIKKLKTGDVLSLEQEVDAPLELIVNQQVIARGQLMCVDDHYAIQLTEVLC